MFLICLVGFVLRWVCDIVVTTPLVTGTCVSRGGRFQYQIMREVSSRMAVTQDYET